jgi:hypothetical protein
MTLKRPCHRFRRCLDSISCCSNRVIGGAVRTAHGGEWCEVHWLGSCPQGMRNEFTVPNVTVAVGNLATKTLLFCSSSVSINRNAFLPGFIEMYHYILSSEERCHELIPHSYSAANQCQNVCKASLCVWNLLASNRIYSALTSRRDSVCKMCIFEIQNLYIFITIFFSGRRST